MTKVVTKIKLPHEFFLILKSYKTRQDFSYIIQRKKIKSIFIKRKIFLLGRSTPNGQIFLISDDKHLTVTIFLESDQLKN